MLKNISSNKVAASWMLASDFTKPRSELKYIRCRLGVGLT